MLILNYDYIRAYTIPYEKTAESSITEPSAEYVKNLNPIYFMIEGEERKPPPSDSRNKSAILKLWLESETYHEVSFLGAWISCHLSKDWN